MIVSPLPLQAVLFVWRNQYIPVFEYYNKQDDSVKERVLLFMRCYNI